MNKGIVSVAAVLAPCSSRKALTPLSSLRAVSLPLVAQSELITAWLSRLSEFPPECTASELYRGRGFTLARQSARHANAPLYVVSAGLGLVDARSFVPSYGVTVADRGDDAVARRVIGKFDACDWWEGVETGPYSLSFEKLFEARRGVILVALSKLYAAMLGKALGALPAEQIGRLRIIGLRLADVLPSQLYSSLVPYDERLEAVLPGTRADFAQRALFHFVANCLSVEGRDAEGDSRAVEHQLLGKEPPARMRRPRLPDRDILKLIRRHLPNSRGIAHLLATVRHTEGIACEQARFTRLYRMAMGMGIE